MDFLSDEEDVEDAIRALVFFNTSEPPLEAGNCEDIQNSKLL